MLLFIRYILRPRWVAAGTVFKIMLASSPAIFAELRASRLIIGLLAEAAASRRVDAGTALLPGTTAMFCATVAVPDALRGQSVRSSASSHQM